MKFRRTCLALTLVAAVAFVSAEQNDAARTLMEAARKKEVVDGDLKGAIQQYQTVAEKYKGDRAVAADALVRMAACYEKLGDTESKRIYERLVREYGDQKDAVAIARTRLGSSVEVLARAGRGFASPTGPIPKSDDGTRGNCYREGSWATSKDERQLRKDGEESWRFAWKARRQVRFVGSNRC